MDQINSPKDFVAFVEKFKQDHPNDPVGAAKADQRAQYEKEHPEIAKELLAHADTGLKLFEAVNNLPLKNRREAVKTQLDLLSRVFAYSATMAMDIINMIEEDELQIYLSALTTTVSNDLVNMARIRYALQEAMQRKQG